MAAPKDLTHSPVWLLATLGTIVLYIFDAEESYKVFNLRGSYTKTTFDHLKSYRGQVFIHEDVYKGFWMLIYGMWPIMLLYLVSTFFRKTSTGYLYKAGHMHWSFLFCAIGGILFHIKWLRNIEDKDISGAMWSSVISFNILVTGLVIMLTVLAKKADDLISQGFEEHIAIMRFMFINVYDFYVLRMFLSMLISIDTYLIAVYDFKPVDSNFYVLLTFAIFQLYFLYSDIYFTNDRTKYLAGGYITMFIDSFGIMLYQMTTLPSVPMITIINAVISLAMPLLKIYLQCQNSGKVKIK